MSQFVLFVAYMSFSVVSHFAVKAIMGRVEKSAMSEMPIPQWFQLIILVALLFAYMCSIWWFCGVVVNSFS